MQAARDYRAEDEARAAAAEARRERAKKASAATARAKARAAKARAAPKSRGRPRDDEGARGQGGRLSRAGPRDPQVHPFFLFDPGIRSKVLEH